jgi:hypothetical protein
MMRALVDGMLGSESATRRIAAAGLALLAATAMVSVAHADGGFSVGLEGGLMEFDDSASVASRGFAWGLRGGISLLGPARLEARFLSAGRDVSGYSETVREGDAQLRLSLLPRATTPYGFAGIGLRTFSTNVPGAGSADTVLVVPFGAGLDLPLSDVVFLAPEFTWHHLIGTPASPAPGSPSGDTWSLALVLRLDI